MGNVVIGKKSDTSKGIINFTNIRHEMVRKDKYYVRNHSKQNLDVYNSKSPVIKRENSYKTKLTPISLPKAITPNKESITQSDISDMSCNRETNNIQPIKKPIIEDRKFSIIDIMASESILYLI
jgi:hypothetical protein